MAQVASNGRMTGRHIVDFNTALGLRLGAEEEYNGADLTIHKITATPEREPSW